MAVINLTELSGKDVYTRNAKYVGKVEDTMLDTEKGNIYGFAIAMSKDSFLYKMLSPPEKGAAGKKTILIPYREILACEDIVLVTVPKKYEKPEEPTLPVSTESHEEEAFLPGVGESETM